MNNPSPTPENARPVSTDGMLNSRPAPPRRPNNANGNEEEERDPDYCCIWPFTLLKNRPVLRIFIVMAVNGLLSMICASLLMLIEGPSQVERMDERKKLIDGIDSMRNEIKDMIKLMGSPDYDSDKALGLLSNFSNTVPKIRNHPKEFGWNMQNAQAFITSVQTTTGYGDIVPKTMGGKLFTIFYAIISIPIFMWYIYRLGGAFRLVFMKAICILLLCVCPYPNPTTESGDHLNHRGAVSSEDPSYSQQSRIRRRSTLTMNRYRILDMNRKLEQQFLEDKRFHPTIIGAILVIFLSLSAAYVSSAENISYFDSFYASFITYSCIGFGDIDIFKTTYNSNWFNFLMYTPFTICGYMILAAWISSLLEKCGVRKF